MQLPDIHFVKVGKGRMALYHRPRGVDFQLLRKMGCTHVVTLLKESEGALKVGAMAQNAGLTWIWLPVPNGDRPVGEIHQRLTEELPRLSQLLDDGSSLLIHCSAGIHRTGTVAYGLLRWRGETRENSLKLIGRMRMVTLDGVGEKRLRWGDAIARDVPKIPWMQSFRESVLQLWQKTFK
jgi:protein-tyrosine phosphatase